MAMKPRPVTATIEMHNDIPAKKLRELIEEAVDQATDSDGVVLNRTQRVKVDPAPRGKVKR